MAMILSVQSRPPFTAQAARLADLAVAALLDEVNLSPKPALVDRRGSGAHDDLSLALMHASARSLWPCFAAMAEAGARLDDPLALREAIGQLGRDGEAAMLAVTAGVNTHRGAIWALGLLVTAAAQGTWQWPELIARAAQLARLPDRLSDSAASHGALVKRRYGSGGAREQAQAGFPAVALHGLPQLRRSRAQGHGETPARLDALLAIMSVLDDTCVLYRAGLPGLHTLQSGARAVLVAGGTATLAGRRRLALLDRQLLQLNASPGGAADLLAACLLIDSIAPLSSSVHTRSAT